MTDVFKVSLPGYDAKGARVGQLSVDSLHPSPKISVVATPPHAGTIFLNWTQTAGVNFDTTQLIYSFPHGLNYVPTVFASYQWTDGTNTQRGTLPFQLGALAIIVIDADPANINLKYFSIDSSIPATTITPFTMQIRFYVMVEPGK